MWSFVPAAIGAGLAMAFAAESTWRNSDAAMARYVLHSMTLNHKMALSAGRDSGLVTGVLQPAPAKPFVNMADWKSEIVSGPSGKFLITWPGNYAGKDERSVSLNLAMVGFNKQDPMPISLTDQLLGRFTTVNANIGRVGDVMIPIPLQAIENGTPVIASPLHD